jgi:hypothetical protein
MRHSKIILSINLLGLLAGFAMIGISVNLYRTESKGIEYAALKGLLVGFLICAFWIIGGATSLRSYTRDHIWPRGKLFTISGLSILIALLLGKIAAVDQPQTRLLFECAFYLMLSGTIIWAQILLLAKLWGSQ